MAERAIDGKVALVTGASKGGTGTAIAIRLAAEGARVAITARDEQGLAATKDRIESSGGECLVLPSDLSDPTGARTELVPKTEEAFGPIDYLVNNAAFGGYHPFEEVTPKQLELSLQVNLVGALGVDEGRHQRDAGAGERSDLEPHHLLSRVAARPPVSYEQTLESRLRLRGAQGGVEQADRVCRQRV